MKNSFGILCAACGFILMASCTDEMDTAFTDSYEGEQPGMTEVSLNLGGDFIDIYDTPLTRAEGQQKKKLYAVNVYYTGLPDDSIRLGDNKEFVFNPISNEYTPYAYGLFDNIKDMKIKLSDKFAYKFECTVIREDMEELQTWWTDYNKSGFFYSYPFIKIDNFISTMLTASYDKPGATEAENPSKISEKQKAKKSIDRTAIINKFQYPNPIFSENLTEIKNGKAYVKIIDNWNFTYGDKQEYKWLKNETYAKNLFSMKDITPAPSNTTDTLWYCSKEYPAIDRWYGELDEYVVGQGPATIEMKRTAFGIKVEVIPPTEGKIKITGKISDKDNKKEGYGIFITEVKPQTHRKKTTYESIFSYSSSRVYNIWLYQHDYVWYWKKTAEKEWLASVDKSLQSDKLKKEYDKAYDKAKEKWSKDSADFVDKDLNEIKFQIGFQRERGNGSKQSTGTSVAVKPNRLFTIFFDASENMVDTSFGITENESMEPDTTIIVK